MMTNQWRTSPKLRRCLSADKPTKETTTNLFPRNNLSLEGSGQRVSLDFSCVQLEDPGKTGSAPNNFAQRRSFPRMTRAQTFLS